jgi:RNA polymerase sigma-54 factor
MPSQSLSLSQTMRQQMKLAPQLRQSLEMLQVPIMELRAMIQTELEQNPTLEDPQVETQNIEVERGSDEPEKTPEETEMDFDKEFEVLAKLDDEWRDYFFQDLDNRPFNPEDARKHQFLMDSIPQLESLQEHLINQVHLASISERDAQLAEMIVGSINEDGYLANSLEELAENSASDVEHLIDLLGLIQDFHPTGIGARDLRECLLLQIERQGLQQHRLAHTIVLEHLTALGAHKYQDIAKELKASPEAVKAATAFIATLDPQPGRAFSAETAAYVLPEVVVRKVEGAYTIVLNDDHLPRVRISRHYRRLMEDKDTPKEVRTYIRDRIRASAFLIKSIDQRQKTIFKIASEIIRVQTPFLDHGITHLKPLTMSTVADACEVHETTVSRAVNGKYMRTPSGNFEMKYFFTPGISRSDGSEVSNEAVKTAIKLMVEAEDQAKPLSDQIIVNQLNTKGIKLARRTVAKYRLMLNIPPSHMRKVR